MLSCGFPYTIRIYGTGKIRLNNILYLSGELALRQFTTLTEQVEQIVKKEKPASIDISGVTALDSAGVAYLEILLNKIKSSDAEATLQGIPDQLKPVLGYFFLQRSSRRGNSRKNGYL